MKKHFRLLALALVFATAAITGCGSSGSDYSTASNGGDIVVIRDTGGPWSAPTDSTITGLELRMSPEYLAPNEQFPNGALDLYFYILDQDGNRFDLYNKYNFQIMIGGYRTVDISDEKIDLSVVSGVTSHTVALGFDNSTSMEAVDSVTGLTSMQLAKNASELYIDSMSPSDKLAIVRFSTEAEVLQAVTKNKTVLKNVIEGIEPDGATNIGDAIIKCVTVLGAYPGKTAAVIMTDGEDNQGFVADGIAEAVKVGMPVFTIGFGDYVNDVELQRIADATGGRFFAASTEDLDHVFSEVMPAAIDELPSRSAQRLRVPYPVAPPAPFTEEQVHLSVVFNFKNAIKTHRVYAGGSCIIAQ